MIVICEFTRTALGVFVYAIAIAQTVKLKRRPSKLFVVVTGWSNTEQIYTQNLRLCDVQAVALMTTQQNKH